MVRSSGNRFHHVARFSLPAAGALLCLPVFAQEATFIDRIPPDGEPWRIERVADIPPQLLPAIRQANCRHDDATLATFPIEIFRPAAGSRPMAIVPCLGIVLYGRGFLFDRDGQSLPRPMAFPVMAFAGQASASETPGLLSWSPNARTLVALQGNDVCDGVIARHTYRHDGRQAGGDLNGFALAKVERGRLGCGGASENWQVIWEADPR
jgi:hypothetical protein